MYPLALVFQPYTESMDPTFHHIKVCIHPPEVTFQKYMPYPLGTRISTTVPSIHSNF